MGAAIQGQAKGSIQSTPLVEGTPACPFCNDKTYMKAETVQMSSVRGAFECLVCGLFRLAKPEEMDVWAKMKGRVFPAPPQSNALTIDHEKVARSTNIVTQ